MNATTRECEGMERVWPLPAAVMAGLLAIGMSLAAAAQSSSLYQRGQQGEFGSPSSTPVGVGVVAPQIGRPHV